MNDSVGCKHLLLEAIRIDQTVGVACRDCNMVLATCWDDHIPESLWNRVAAQDTDLNPCTQGRDDVCGICGEPIEANQPTIG